MIPPYTLVEYFHLTVELNDSPLQLGGMIQLYIDSSLQFSGMIPAKYQNGHFGKLKYKLKST